MGGCAQQSRNGGSERTEELNEPVPAGSYMHPAERRGYMDAVDPDAYPPTPGQGSWQE